MENDPTELAANTAQLAQMNKVLGELLDEQIKLREPTKVTVKLIEAGPGWASVVVSCDGVETARVGVRQGQQIVLRKGKVTFS